MKRWIALGALALLFPLRWLARDKGPCWEFAHAWDDVYDEDPSSIVDASR